MIDYKTLSDYVLSKKLKDGDQAALAEIFDRYQFVLYRHANKWLQDREAVKDTIQEVFIAIWDKRESITYTENLGGYLYTALRNRILRQIKLDQRKQNYLSSLENHITRGENITDHLVRENQLRAIIEKEVASLPDKMREVFELSRNSQLSHSEIAARLGISELTVKTQVKNALRFLRTRLGFIIYIWMVLFY